MRIVRIVSSPRTVGCVAAAAVAASLLAVGVSAAVIPAAKIQAVDRAVGRALDRTVNRDVDVPTANVTRSVIGDADVVDTDSDSDANANAEVMLLLDGESVVAGGGESCVSLGTHLNVNFGNSVFRGNMFRVLTEATVAEFGFELDINLDQPKTLHLSVHRRVGDTGATFQRARADVVLDRTGTGEVELYTTGDLSPVVLLEEDVIYVFAISWDGAGVSVGRNPAQASAPGSVLPGFSTATFVGEANLPLLPDEPPIDPDDEGVVIFAELSGGPWSMQVCLGGACCVPGGGCTDVSETECQDLGGSFTVGGETCNQLIQDELGCPLVQGACCGANNTCGQTSKFTCADIDGTWFKAQACDATICLPKGACCVGEGQCADNVIEDDCETLVGVYRGDDTMCNEVEPRCTVGACCLLGDACDVQTKSDCQASSGEFLGFGIGCTPVNPCLPPIPVGACCDGDSCSELTEQECFNIPGSYRGDDTLCADLAVACGRGACCTGSGCFQTTENTCNAVGAFQDEGTSCATIEPQCVGTCCWSQGCADDVSPAICAGPDGLPGGLFVGYGVSCPVIVPPNPNPDFDPCNDPEPSGACCLETGACVHATLAACLDLLGTYRGNDTTCELQDCTPAEPEGACCIAGNPDTCIELTQSLCDTASGLYLGDDILCSDPEVDCVRGACCLIEGGCAHVVPAECAEMGGAFQIGGDCTAGECLDGGACCLLNGDCTPLRDESLCAAAGGAFKGEGTACDDIDLTCTRGACCPDTGLCALRLEVDCVLPDLYRGDNTICPDSCEFGTCCFPDGTCAETDKFACTEMNGLFETDLTCQSDTCPASGACCLLDAGCELRFEVDCPVPDVYRGDDTTCEEACEPGACCFLGGGCIDTDKLECVAGGGGFFAGTDCNSTDCTQNGACCLEDGTCDQRFVVQCEDPDVFRGAQTFCEQACVPGSCCFMDGSCIDTDNLDCDIQEGAFLTGVDCANADCPGACCLLDGSCADTDNAGCDALGGAFVDNSDCLGTVCPGIGACCLDAGGCEIRFETQCLTPDVYRGDDTLCAEVCDPGACCLPDGACADTDNLSCNDLGGEFQANEACANGVCPGACCTANELCIDGITRTACEGGAGAAFVGPAVDCSDEGQCVRGACCHLDGTCDEVFAFQCDAALDGFHPDTPCADIVEVCVPQGACCAGGTCSETTPESCAVCNDGPNDGLACTVDEDCGECSINNDPCSTATPCSSVCSSDANILCTKAGECPLGDECVPQTCNAGSCGDYFGDGVVCVPDACANSACCMDDGTCEDTSQGPMPGPISVMQCVVDGGNPVAGSVCSPDACPAAGACCLAEGACGQLTETACGEQGGSLAGEGVPCDGPVCAMDACCRLDGTCVDDLFGYECDELTGTVFEGFACAGVGGQCEPRGACCDGLTCTIEPEADCLAGGRNFRGVGVTCDPSPCQFCGDGPVSFTNPLDGTRDARQPHELGDALALQGFDVFSVIAPENADAKSGVCWSLCETAINPALHAGLAPNSIVSVVDIGSASYVITLTRPITPGEVTTITYDNTSMGGITVETGTFHYLPCDVNMDGTCAPADILAIIDCLNGVAVDCAEDNTDLDRSNELGPPDILRVIDLLNGASAFEVWLDANLPLDTICP